MPGEPANGAVRDLCRLVQVRDGAAQPDPQLLGRFLATGDGAAFEVLVRRHGPMVLGVCRRVLRNTPDAEDAFQATFLVLLRRASAIRDRASLGPWLYGVATRIAVRAKAMYQRQQQRIAGLAAPAERPASDGLDEVVDQEVGRLPARLRNPIVLCELQGLSRKEAAERLGIPEGTLSSRLARGRQTLKRRLMQRGVALGAGSLAAAPTVVPPALLAATLRTAESMFARAGVAVLSAKVRALADAATSGLLAARLKVGAVLLGLGLFAVGFGLGQRMAADRAVGAGADANEPAVAAHKSAADEAPAEANDAEAAEAADEGWDDPPEPPPAVTPPPPPDCKPTRPAVTFGKARLVRTWRFVPPTRGRQ